MRYIQPKITAVHSAVSAIQGPKIFEPQEVTNASLTSNAAYTADE